MTAILSLAVGVGLAVGLVMTEVFGLAVGGMIVPGYVALHLTQPVSVLLTLAAALFTFVIVRALSAVVIIYGRRRTALMVLVGYLVNMLLRWMAARQGASPSEVDVIGFIIPGLIAIWFDRQGMVETTCSLVTAAVIVRMILILVVGHELLA